MNREDLIVCHGFAVRLALNGRSATARLVSDDPSQARLVGIRLDDGTEYDMAVLLNEPQIATMEIDVGGQRLLSSHINMPDPEYQARWQQGNGLGIGILGEPLN